jgi:hypothetical protein
MTTNTKFDDLTLVEQGLILKNGKKKTIEIPFSELDKIYIKVSKLKPVYELALILLPFLIIFLSLQFAYENVMFVGFSSVIPVFVKINNYKNYSLIVSLKDGTVFRKKVSLRGKNECVTVVNAVRKEQLNHYTKINASPRLEYLDVFSKKAS